MVSFRIVSHEPFYFADRRQAALLLARELRDLHLIKPVVLGIPRGGVLTAYWLSRELAGAMNVIFAHKLHAPGDPESAIGSVEEGGKLFLYKSLSGLKNVPYIEEEKKREFGLLARRAAEYRRHLPKISLFKRDVVVTDDGAATGLTMQAALWAARSEKPKRLVAALPMAPAETAKDLSESADFVLCLSSPARFVSVGEFYTDFSPVSDEMLVRLLKDEASGKHTLPYEKTF